jgi:hypothetical protein
MDKKNVETTDQWIADSPTANKLHHWSEQAIRRFVDYRVCIHTMNGIWNGYCPLDPIEMATLDAVNEFQGWGSWTADKIRESIYRYEKQAYEKEV